MIAGKHRPIGIFDSGIGGLSICHAVKSIIPEEDVLYFADVEFSPYGTKSTKMIVARSEYIVNHLVEQGCKLIVVACNTATVNSIAMLRSKYSVPIVGVEPGIKPAALNSKKGVIGVLATEQTIKSDSFKRLKSIYDSSVQIETKACPEFVSLVENLEHKSALAVDIAEQYIRPLLLAGCDQLILGCTHFSFLMDAIQAVVQKEAKIIDTAVPVVMEIKKQLFNRRINNAVGLKGETNFWTSGNSENTARTISNLWGQEVKVIQTKP